MIVRSRLIKIAFIYIMVIKILKGSWVQLKPIGVKHVINKLIKTVFITIMVIKFLKGRWAQTKCIGVLIVRGLFIKTVNIVGLVIKIMRFKIIWIFPIKSLKHKNSWVNGNVIVWFNS